MYDKNETVKESILCVAIEANFTRLNILLEDRQLTKREIKKLIKTIK